MINSIDYSKIGSSLDSIPALVQRPLVELSVMVEKLYINTAQCCRHQLCGAIENVAVVTQELNF